MPIPVFGSNTESTPTASTTCAVPIPTGVAEGSVIIVAVRVDTGVETITPPTGFTETTSSPISITSTGANVTHVYWKRQGSATGAGETTGTYDFTLSATPTVHTGIAHRYGGVIQSGDPFDATNSAVKLTTTDGTTPAVSLTTTDLNRELVWIASNSSGGGTTAPGTFTIRTDWGNNGLGAASKDQAASGSSGSVSGSFATAGKTGAWLGALEPGGPLAWGNATTTASRSPAITFSNYTPIADDIVAFWAASGAAAAAATAPTNWVLPTPAAGANPVASDSHTQAFTYHVVTSGEASGGTVTYTATNLWNVAQTGNVVGAVLRGIDTTTPIDSIVSTFSSANAATPHVLAALTGTDLSTDSIVLSAVAKDGTGTYTTPAGWAAVTSSNTNQGHWLGYREGLTTSGTNVAATNITPSAGDEYCSITVAFTKGLAGPTPNPGNFFQMW